MRARPPEALRQLPPQPPESAEAYDPSKMRLLKAKTGARRFEPTPGATCEAQFTNGEWYTAKIMATSRADDGSQTFVTRFEDDGVTLHLRPEMLRRAA